MARQVELAPLLFSIVTVVLAALLAVVNRARPANVDFGAGIKGGPSWLRTSVLLVPLAAVVIAYFASTDDDAIRVLVIPPLRLLGGAGALWVLGNLVLRLSKKARMAPLDMLDVAICHAAMNFPYLSGPP